MNRARLLILFSILFLTLASGCAGPNYYFEPTSPTPLTPRGQLGATYALPEGQTKSSIRIVARGIHKIRGSKVLQIRYYLENTDPTPWHLDVRKQKIVLPSGGPELVGSDLVDVQSDAVVEIPKKVARLVDLYFAVPQSVDGDASLDGFELKWEVAASVSPARGTVDFTRTVTEKPPEDTNAPTATKARRRTAP